MSKLLLLVVAVVVIYFLVTGFARKRKHSAPSPSESMVACAHCGINLPRSEALKEGGRFFCSEDHLKAGSA